MGKRTYTLHGHTSVSDGASRTYRIWSSMVQRCTNPKSCSYYKYGGRGITLDEGWRLFPNFLKDMGEAPEGCSLDRVDNDAGYSKNNCRWATQKEQCNNTRTNRRVVWNGEEMTVTRLAEIVGVSRKRIYTRLDAGWPLEEAVRPPMPRGRAIGKVVQHA